MISTNNLASDAQRLKGKVALITGAASGIGLATAKLFHLHGAKVVMADIQDQLGRQACDEINSITGAGEATYVHCDVTEEDDVRQAVDGTVSKYGKLDIMYNNAGILDPTMSSATEAEKSVMEKLLRVNVVGMFLGAKHAARVMVPAKQGSIIFTASVASVMGISSLHAYCASKHAVAGLTKSMAVELGGHGVRVNCISPSSVYTALTYAAFGNVDEATFYETVNTCSHLKGVNLTAEVVADAALHLASDESKFTTGHNLVLDGGCSIGFRAFT